MQDYITLARQHREILVDKCVAHLFSAANGLSSSFTFSNREDVGLHIETVSLNGSSTSSQQNKEPDALKFKRCLEMLKYFMDYFDTKYLFSKVGQTLIRRHGMLNDGKMITIKVKLIQGPVSNSTLMF